MNNQFNKTLLASLLTFSAAGVHAAAFQLAEISTSGLGMAYAGNAAVADNASVVATNPALMTKFKSTEFSAGGILVDADVNVSGKIGRVFDASHGNIIPNAVIPNLYVVTPVNDRFSLGGGLNVNYGLKSEYNEQFNAGVYGGKTELTALNFNLSGAYNFGNGLSFGLGLNAIHSDAEVQRHLGVGGKALAQQLVAKNPEAAKQLANMPATTSVSQIKGDEWSFGWNAGLSYELNESHRWGLAYHSAVDVKFKGKYSNDFPEAYNALLAQLANSGVNLPISEATGGKAVPGRLTLNLPAYWEFSGFHKLTEKLALQYSYKYTEWDRLKSLTAYGSKGNILFHKDENFSNSSRYSLGFSYDVDEALTVRTGFAYDENASVKHPSISIPDTDRTWYSVGATYRFTPNLSADVGFAHLRGKKNSFKEGQSAVFQVSSKANLYGLNLNYKF
ncbi:outer membrane protein transport protein [Actinobacillus equuli subsp. equuli]|uniref:Outer membrane protein transport protein n=1 Tax=Actinobacillus equuli subsp. equuli TaxID=202947 RepID=A0A9X4JDT1_ACTEU|nr:porin [Actinobacillus equuli]MDE8034844.1 outer membrane protein transport protein [Actinobacillus equuli subsp. equuli]MDG4948946.1 outer membrane protein transport protein [Actinobacillus equuli subsp. haemolyticus]